jgi:hypothetical protein
VENTESQLLSVIIDICILRLQRMTSGRDRRVIRIDGFSDDHHTPHVTGCTATVSTELLEEDYTFNMVEGGVDGFVLDKFPSLE